MGGVSGLLAAVVKRPAANQQVSLNRGISKPLFGKSLSVPAANRGDCPGFLMIRKLAFLLLVATVLTPLALHANQAFRAYDATPIFGDMREVVREGNKYTYRFPYRGGTVSYRPKVGADWKKEGSLTSSREVAGSARAIGNSFPTLPNGCMVFACARAEEMRRIPSRGSRSQVIAYKRFDGSGHAFVVYEKDGKSFAEDDRGYRLQIPSWKARTAAEALALSEYFQQRTHPASFPAPIRASFVGEF
jgi:hypothetical protein